MRAAVALAVVVLASGCGDADEPPGTGAQGAPIRGGGLSVAEAKASSLDGPLMVAGHLAEVDGRLHLCDGLRESYPPQCVEPSLRVEGDVEGEVGERVSLLGEVDGDVIRVSATSQG